MVMFIVAFVSFGAGFALSHFVKMAQVETVLKNAEAVGLADAKILIAKVRAKL